jgi:hypothetical protein
MLVSSINYELKNVSVLNSIGTVCKASCISASELAISSIHFSKSVGLVGEIIYHNLLSVRDETIAENALAKSQTAEEEAQANA